MPKLIAALNITIDGICDHTAGVPDEEVHNHYTELLNGSDIILYGRTTYELMDFWKPLVQNPTGEKSMDDFAVAIDRIHKIVFSNTLTTTGWESATLADKPLEDVAAELKRKQGRDVLVGSRSLIVQLANLNLIDEFQLCIHPVIAGKGLPLFDKINNRTLLKLTKTRTFKRGAVLHYYEPDPLL
jgi:dihydrofolate reductase